MIFVVFSEVDAKLVDVAGVHMFGFTFVSSYERHVAKQVPGQRFLLKEEIRVKRKWQQLFQILFLEELLL